MNSLSGKIFFGTIIVLFASLFFLEIFLNKKKTEETYKPVTYQERIDTCEARIPEYGKGGIIVGNDKYIVFNSKLVQNNDGFSNWILDDPIISFSKEPYTYRLMNVPFPYRVFKKKYSDTLEVFIDNYKLKFKIYKIKSN